MERNFDDGEYVWPFKARLEQSDPLGLERFLVAEVAMIVRVCPRGRFQVVDVKAVSPERVDVSRVDKDELEDA